MRNNVASDDDDFDDLDELVTPTQIAATQPRVSTSAAAIDTAEHPSRAAKAAVDERVLCAVCSLNLTMWTIQDRAVHMNACIDAMTTTQSKYYCPTCTKELTDYNEQRRMAHVNMCLDRLQTRAAQQESMIAKADDGRVEAQPSTTIESVAVQDEPDPNAYNCMICGVNLTEKDLTARIRHVKQCGQRFGVRPSDVAALQREHEHGQLPPTNADQSISTESATTTSATAVIEVLDDDAQTDTSSLSTNAFAVMMRASSSASSSSVLSNAIGRVGQVVSNAFDVLMKSSKTQAVLSSASVTTSGSSFRSNPQPFSKKRRLGGGTSSSGMQWSSSSSSSTSRRFSCPDFKRIKGTHPSFIVDGFKYASKALSSVYFLTHFHSDHYIGLEKKITAALVVQELRIDSKWVHPVPMNTPVMIHDVQVTFMDANHCPGAAIILFHLKNGQAYLHTGDFRYDKKMLSYAPLQKYVLPPGAPPSTTATTRLDGVYLDTTYANPKYTFPTQQAAVDHTLELLATKHAVSDNKILFLFGSYSIGKERLFMEVAAKYARKVCVSKAKLKFISTFGWPEDQMKLLTVEPSATNLHVVPMGDLSMEHLTALLQKHRLRFREIVAFRPTGWTFSKSNAGASISTCRTDASGAIRIYGIPYSEHSSFAELTEFVQAMNPHVIIPTVNCYTKQQAKKQVNLLRQSAFHSISNLFQQQHAMSRSRNESQVLSLDNAKESSGSAPSTRPPSSSGRSTKQANKLSEFRQCLDRDELPLAIETRKHDDSRRVTWTAAQLEPLEFAHLLLICVSGLQDALEPYPTFAFDAAMALLESSGKADDPRVLQALPQVMNQVKSALGTREKVVVHRVLLLLQQLAVCDGVGDALTEYYRSILPLCNILQDKHLGTGDDATKALVAETLETMEAYGKDDAHLLIQQYVPSFQSCAG
uniref:DNA repair metallo-beta-lactamase domain-containing protein n=1 Tax=Globisporangium ultimum (strain ATCC 200006 / CBS 805.95 / DAOM BR144) TaxID=431595 RepID=K3W9S1_GLOUD